MIWKEDRKRQFDMIFLIIDRVFGAIEGKNYMTMSVDIFDFGKA